MKPLFPCTLISGVKIIIELSHISLIEEKYLGDMKGLMTCEHLMIRGCRIIVIRPGFSVVTAGTNRNTRADPHSYRQSFQISAKYICEL